MVNGFAEGGGGGRLRVPAVCPGRSHLHVMVHLRAPHQISIVSFFLRVSNNIMTET
jgi:hypothetical protein